MEEILIEGTDENHEFQIPKQYYLSRHNFQKQLNVLQTIHQELISNKNQAVDVTSPVQISKIAKLDTIKKPEVTSASAVVVDSKKMEDTVITNYKNQNNYNRKSFLKENDKFEQISSSSDSLPSTSASTLSIASGVTPIIEPIKRRPEDYFKVVAPKGEMADKLAKAAPYNFFLTTIADSKPTHFEPLSITFLGLFLKINYLLNSCINIINYSYAHRIVR